MKYNLIFKLAGIIVCMSGLKDAYGAFVESTQQNANSTTSTQSVTHSEDREYEKYSHYTSKCVEEGRAKGIAEGIASIIRSGLLSYDTFMASDHYSDNIKARVTQLLKPVSQ